MREHDLQAPSRTGHAHGPKAHDGTITTEAPDVMWGTDMTATVTVAEGCFRHQLLLPRPYLVLTKPLRLDIQCQRAASAKIGWKYLDD